MLDTHAVRLIVLDIDGTIVGPGTGVTSRLRAALVSARDRGIQVVLATGRWMPSARPLAQELGLTGAIILHNGAVVAEACTGAFITRLPLPHREAREAIHRVLACGGQPIVYESPLTGGGIVVGVEAQDSVDARRYLASKQGVRRVDLTAEPLVPDPTQIVIADRGDRVASIVRVLTDGPWQMVESMSVAVPEARFIEILARGATKGRAAARLAAGLGITREGVLAIGDNFNDLDLIQWSGVGVAMGDAPDPVRRAADWVAPPLAEDGAAIAIERFALGITGRRAPAAAGGSRG